MFAAPTPPWPLLVLWAAWIVQAVLSWLAARHLARRLAEPDSTADRAYRPFATVIVPCKGIEDRPQAALAALAQQEYLRYRVVLVVESQDDPAHDVAQEFAARGGAVPVSVVVAGVAPPDQGQKVHNQLAALAAIDAQCADDDVWVFADSDAVPDRQWLGRLVGALRRKGSIVTTGYRWLMPEAPETGAPPTMWSHLASVLNSSGACLQAVKEVSRAWGGAMAIRVGDARRGKLRERWRGAITDDFPLSTLARELGGRVRFVPRCLAAGLVALDGAALWRFARRQYLITRIYSPRIFAIALGAMWLYVAGTLSAWMWLGRALLSNAGNAWLWPIAVISLVFAANQLRANARVRCVRLAFGEDGLARLRAALSLDRWATTAWMTLHALLLASAACGRTIIWRGVRYRIRGRNEVVRLE